MSTIASTLTLPPEVVPPLALGPLIVATDGSSSSDAAFTAARLLAGRSGSDVHVLSVLEPLSRLVPSLELLEVPPDADESRAERLCDRVRQQMRAVVGERLGWRVEVKLGQPAAVIARIARERGAQLIVTGVRRHGPIERLLGGETPLHLAQLATTPLLVAAPELDRLPRCIVVATDLSPTGMQAARTALALFPDVSTLYLLHVTSHFDLGPAGRSAWTSAYRSRTREALERMKASLDLPPRMQAHTITPTGDAAEEILDFAAYARADLIVTGTRRHGSMRRLLLGTVASRVLRGAACSVLLVPEGGQAALTLPA